MTRSKRALLVVCLLAVVPVIAQNSSVRGELRDLSGSADHFTIQVTNMEHRADPQRAFVGSNGSFQFQSLAQGSYMLEVRNLSGEVLKQQMLSVFGLTVEVSISLKPLRSSSSAALPPAGKGATVSVNQLRHDPSGAAAREYALGEQYLLRKDLAGARKHLLKAVKADPDYAEAHLELGTTAFRSGQLDEARREYERAVELDPKHPIAWGNLASLLFQTKAYPEAEAAAHHGLEASPSDAKLNFVAGASAYARGQFDEDTTQHFEQASKQYPNAHLLLAETLLRMGKVRSVMAHLKASLVSDNEQVRTRAQELMGKLAAATGGGSATLQ